MTREATPPIPELTDTLLERLPLFPLPNAVLFPGAILPLHFFEPRYRALAEYCVRGPRVMAIGAIQPGFEVDYDGRPPVLPVLSVGAIHAERRHPDGRWDISLRGLARVELLSEHPASEPFRLIRARRLREHERRDDTMLAERLRSAVIQLLNLIPSLWPQLDPQLVAARTPSALADIIAANFIDDPSARRVLLEQLEVGRRLDMIQSVVAQLILEATLRAHQAAGSKPEFLH